MVNFLTIDIFSFKMPPSYTKTLSCIKLHVHTLFYRKTISCFNECKRKLQHEKLNHLMMIYIYISKMLLIYILLIWIQFFFDKKCSLTLQFCSLSLFNKHVLKKKKIWKLRYARLLNYFTSFSLLVPFKSTTFVFIVDF